MATVTIGGRNYDVTVQGNTVTVDGQAFAVKTRDDGAYTTVTVGNVPFRVQLPADGGRESGMEVQVDYRPYTVEFEGKLGGGGAGSRGTGGAPRGSGGAVKTTAKGGVMAQISGRIISVKVKPGDEVEAGQVLLLLEAMKMENEIKAPAGGTVKEVLIADGDRVAEGDTLVVLE